jgi:hypothetical protein
MDYFLEKWIWIAIKYNKKKLNVDFMLKIILIFGRW